MEDGDRWTIPELLARYALEPSLRDVFVEGSTDQALLRRALRHLVPDSEIKVYEIASVDVPAALVEDLSLNVGNKGRVVALACEFERSASPLIEATVVCLADTDLDRLRERCITNRVLVYTSQLSLDSFLASSRTVDRFFDLVVRSSVSADALFEQMLPILHERVLQRAAADELGIVVDPPSLVRCCTLVDGILTADLAEFATRYLSKAGATGLRHDMEAAVERYRRRTQPLALVHIDDFLELLHFCARRATPRATPGIDQLRRFLPAIVDDEELERLPEVVEIARRLGSGPPAQAA